MLNCRLVLFFSEVRRLAPELEWTFQLVTANGYLSEREVVRDGWPAQFYTLTIRVVQQIKNGSMDMDLAVEPRIAAKFFAGEAARIVAEVRREFGKREW